MKCWAALHWLYKRTNSTVQIKMLKPEEYHSVIIRYRCRAKSVLFGHGLCVTWPILSTTWTVWKCLLRRAVLLQKIASADPSIWTSETWRWLKLMTATAEAWSSVQPYNIIICKKINWTLTVFDINLYHCLRTVLYVNADKKLAQYSWLW